VEERFRSQRTVTAQMEPRAALGQYDAATGHYLLTSGCQGAHRMRAGLCAAMKLTPDRLRVVVPDVGGGFGTRTNTYTEQLGVLWAAKIVEGMGLKQAEVTSSEADALRKSVIEKDRLFFNRWRPANETYLFGFRKHEQGRNAAEVDEFDPIIEQQDKKIDTLKRDLLAKRKLP
jgi:hypothetical protein